MEDLTKQIFKEVDAEAAKYDDHEFNSCGGFINAQIKERHHNWIVWPPSNEDIPFIKDKPVSFVSAIKMLQIKGENNENKV